MTAVAVMAHATVNGMASVVVTVTRKVVLQDAVRARKAIPKRAVKADARVDGVVVVAVAAVVVMADAAMAKVHHKVKARAKATASVLTPKASHKPQT